MAQEQEQESDKINIQIFRETHKKLKDVGKMDESMAQLIKRITEHYIDCIGGRA